MRLFRDVHKLVFHEPIRSDIQRTESRDPANVDVQIRRSHNDADGDVGKFVQLFVGPAAGPEVGDYSVPVRLGRRTSQDVVVLQGDARTKQFGRITLMVQWWKAELVLGQFLPVGTRAQRAGRSAHRVIKKGIGLANEGQQLRQQNLVRPWFPTHRMSPEHTPEKSATATLRW